MWPSLTKAVPVCGSFGRLCKRGAEWLHICVTIPDSISVVCCLNTALQLFRGFLGIKITYYAKKCVTVIIMQVHT